MDRKQQETWICNSHWKDCSCRHLEKQLVFIFSRLNTGYRKAEKYTYGWTIDRISENTCFLFKRIETLRATNSHIDWRNIALLIITKPKWLSLLTLIEEAHCLFPRPPHVQIESSRRCDTWNLMVNLLGHTKNIIS